AVLLVAKADVRDEVNQFAQAGLVERGAVVIFGQDTLEVGIGFLDSLHRLVNQLADGGLLGISLKVRPASGLRDPKDVLGGVFVAVLGVGVRLFFEGFVAFLESVGDIFEEDEAKHNVLVFGSVHVAAQLVCGLPQFGLKT